VERIIWRESTRIGFWVDIQLSKYWVSVTIIKSERSENLSQVAEIEPTTICHCKFFFGSFHNLENQEYNMYQWSRKSDIRSGIHVSCIDSNEKKKQFIGSWTQSPLGSSWSITQPCQLLHHVDTPCLDPHQGLPHRPHSVRAIHQAGSEILIKNVRTTSGRGLKFSQNMSRPPSSLATYYQGSCITLPWLLSLELQWYATI